MLARPLVGIKLYSKNARFLSCSKCWEVVLEETPLLEMSRPQLGELQ